MKIILIAFFAILLSQDVFTHCGWCEEGHTMLIATRPKKKEVEKKVPVEKVEKYPIELKDGVKFVFEGKAKKVFVAGSFNNWDPEANPMKEVKLGHFELFLPLSPGRYEYKFVVDGNWITDPKNPEKITTPDGFINSLLIFRGLLNLKGPEIMKWGVKFTYYAPKAKTVHLCGDFNNWTIGADPMVKDKAGVWSIEKKLLPGIYKYKFVVNETEWFADPFGVSANDEYGNSIIKFVPPGLELGPKITTKEGKKFVTFTYYAPDATDVYLCGDFNGWKIGADLMKKTKEGIWEITKPLPVGSYKYKFVVDGSWIKDPFGVSAGDEYDNSLIEVK